MEKVMRVYSAETISSEGLTKLKVNIPELFPTLLKDDKDSTLTIQNGYFLNTNYPPTSSTIKISNYLTMNIGYKIKYEEITQEPERLKVTKGQPFIMLSPTRRLEDSVLINI